MPPEPPDFSRDVRCILGLPFDAVSEDQAQRSLRRSIQARRRCFLSTPNLNFAVACQSDAVFRASVMQSDLSVADGWPIVAIARLTGAPLPGRVTGSGLFERLVASTERPPVSVYFFGGPDGAARAACARLNDESRGVRCVGYEAPGFGTIDEMSSDASLGCLNSARPDFVVVALGAKKGQAWIQRNFEQIEAPVVSHLGAVVNFAAGTVRRAPRWVQAARLEWLWRIKEERSLWRRYLKDGLSLLRLGAAQVLPFAIDQWRVRHDRSGARVAQAQVRQSDAGCVLELIGTWSASNSFELRATLATAAESRTAVFVELSRCGGLDVRAIGLLLLLHGWQTRNSLGWSITNASHRSRESLRFAGAEFLLETLH
jgi:N-acetylglucosaminyldiphosphoundecaprenol N-acetyl-beta-D-mannosaminyltransferase